MVHSKLSVASNEILGPLWRITGRSGSLLPLSLLRGWAAGIRIAPLLR
jgi:hypothetical protein